METEEVELSRLLMQNHSKCKVSEELQLPEVKDNIFTDLSQQRTDSGGTGRAGRRRNSDGRCASCEFPLCKSG